MKQSLIPLVFLLLTFFSCERREPHVYEYETNPKFTKGYVEFWGPFYAGYDIANNVLSLTALTDSLLINQDGYLYGYGQYLYLEDIFLPSTDTLFSSGVYKVSDSGEAFTIAPGRVYSDKDTIGNAIKDIGACIFYYEKTEDLSKRRFITDGKMTVTQVDQYTDFDFKFVLDGKDSTKIEGSFRIQDLDYYDMSNFASVISKQRGRWKKRMMPF